MVDSVGLTVAESKATMTQLFRVSPNSAVKNPEDNSAYVFVFIALASDGTDVRALFELLLLDQSGKGKHKVHSHFNRSLESGPYTFKYRGTVMRSEGFDYLREHCPSLQSELLKIVAGCEEELSGGGGRREAYGANSQTVEPTQMREAKGNNRHGER